MEWASKTLGEIADEVGGTIRTGPFGSQLHSYDYEATGTPVVMPQDIVDDKISVRNIARVGETHVERLAQHKLRDGDIVYGRRGDIGRRALVTKREEGWLCGTGCLRLSLGDSLIDPRYLYYYLGDSRMISWIYNQAIGSTMPNLNTSILRSIPVRLPPLPIQRRITDILSAYDALIENNARRIAILEEMAQRLYREWFVHFRFPGHEAVRMVVGEDGVERPEGWGVRRLGEVAELVIGQSPSSEFYNEEQRGLPFHQGVADFGRRFPTHRVYCTVDHRVAEAGDILFSVRAPVGRINIANRKLVIGRGLHAIRHRADYQTFTFHQLSDKFYEEDMMGNGAIFKSVTKADMLGIEMLTPPDAIIEIFEETARPIARQVEVLDAKNATLRATRDLLLPKLVAGEIEVGAVEGAMA